MHCSPDLPVLAPAPPAPAPPGPPTRPAASDDLPPDLPPLDGDDDERETDAPRLDDDEMPKDDGGDPFDDATGEEDAAPELVGLDDEKGSLLDAGEADSLDIGAPDLVGVEGDRLTDDGREDERPHEEYGLDAEDGTSALDAGEEGPATDDESLSDDGLPPLDQDDDDARDDAEAFFDGELGAALGARAPTNATWSTLWERFGPPLSLPASRALACVRAGVVSAGRELVRVDLEGATERLAARGLRGGEATRVLVVADAMFATTERGGLFVSRDGGATFAEVSGWREHVRPEEAAAGLDVVASSDGALWGRTAQGSLLTSADRGERWEKADVDGFVHALGVDEQGHVVVLVRALAASEVLRRVAAGWARTAIPGELLPHSMTGAANVLARGKSVAIAIEGGGVFRSLDGGVWSHLAGTASVTAMAMLDGSGTLVVALQGGGESGAGEDDVQPAQSSIAHLARIGADGEPKVVAVWEERNEGEAGVTAIAVDEAHEVVWVAGGFGVAAFQPKMLQ